MKIKQNIPNLITCGNLFCGCLAIEQAFNGNLVWAAYLVGIAAILDFFDGFAARLLNVSSPIGKDLDSLADMVTFGVVPGIIMFKMLQFMLHFDIIKRELVGTVTLDIKSALLPYTAFLIPVFSAIRLAKFNNDKRQSDSFIGLPTPANSIFICSIPLIVNWQGNYIPKSIESGPDLLVLNPYFLLAITIIFSLLLVTELPLIALKFKSFGWKGNQIRYIFLTGCLLLLAFFKIGGIALCILFYILVSYINNQIRKS